jgi:hypothetical protein
VRPARSEATWTVSQWIIPFFCDSCARNHLLAPATPQELVTIQLADCLPVQVKLDGNAQADARLGSIRPARVPCRSTRSRRRTPDLIVQPNIGHTYTGSTKKQAEHGGFEFDDTNVMMRVSNPSIRPATVPRSSMRCAPKARQYCPISSHLTRTSSERMAAAVSGRAPER